MEKVTRKRRPQSERRQRSIDLILDHAEVLFARHGYDVVTLSAVANAAGIDTALMRYYFGDKRKLFDAVFHRRGPDVNAVRLAAMEAYEACEGDRITLEGVISAFVAPALRWMEEAPEHRAYGAIVAFVNSSQGHFHDLMSEVFDPVSRILLAEMRRVLPDAEMEDIYWGYHLLTGAYTFSIGQTGRIDTLSDGLCNSHDLSAIAERLPMVLAAGIEAMCKKRPLPPR